MNRYDTIDIFFIAIISAYFITLICIVLAFIISKIRNIFGKNKINTSYKQTSNNKDYKPIKPKKEKVKIIKVRINKPKRIRKPLSSRKIIRKLFMEPVPKKDIYKTKQINIKDIKTERLKSNNSEYKDKRKEEIKPISIGKIEEKKENAPITIEGLKEIIEKIDNKGEEKTTEKTQKKTASSNKKAPTKKKATATKKPANNKATQTKKTNNSKAKTTTKSNSKSKSQNTNKNTTKKTNTTKQTKKAKTA